MGGYVRTGLLVLLSRILLVSGITVKEAKYQLQKNADRREFMGRMSASAELDFENEILSGTETASYNKKLRSKIRPLETGKFLPSSRRAEDGAAADDGGGEEEWYEEEANYYNWNGLGVDIADYSLKYHKCTTMSSFIGGEDGGDNESPFVENTFVTFRLCPTDSCVADGWDGCRETYGEYMMGMEDFVEAQASYDEQLFEQFCNYCQTCMYFENYFYGNNRRLNDQHACKYYDDCYNYESVCEDEDNEGGADLTLSTLVQCIAIEDAIQEDDYYDDANNNGENQYWLGLACRSTLQIALFSDEDCSQFVSNSNKIFNITGYDVPIDDDLMGPFLSHQCISCRESDLPYLISYADEDDEDDIVELCEEVYLASARCDQRLWEVEYEDAVDQYNAERTCDFIENVIKGNVNEFGLLQTETPDFFHNWIPQQYWPEDDIIISQDEVAYLTMGILGCMVMLIYISYFKKQLAKHPEPLLQTNIYGSDSQPLSSTTSGFQSFETTPTTSGPVSEDSKDTKFDPVAAARSID